MKIDLRSTTETERTLIEAVIEKMAEAGYDEDVEDVTHLYREAAALARALTIIQARKTEKPKPRKRGGASSSGKTPDFDSGDAGSTPAAP